MDSLNLIKLNVIIEETFDITMPDFTPERTELRAVRDVVSLVTAQVSQRRAAGGTR